MPLMIGKAFAVMSVAVVALPMRCAPTATWESKCPAVSVVKAGNEFTKERDFLGRWNTPGGVILGFSAQEDGVVYQTRWCADHMPQS